MSKFFFSLLLKVKFYANYLKFFLFRHSRVVLLIFFILILLFFLVINLKAKLNKDSITEGIIGTYTERDIPEVVTRLLSPSLVVLDQNGVVGPNLIKEWKSNEDNTEYTIKLKDGLYWSDGTKLRSADINLVIPDVEITILDEQTLKFKLADSFSPFMSLLTRPLLKKDHIIGLGPYSLSQIQKDKIFVKKLVLKSKDNKLPEIIIRFYPNEKIAKNALKLGEIQSILGINDMEFLHNLQNLATLSKTNYRQLVTIFYNTKDPILSDENLRLALSFSAPSIAGETEAHTSIPPKSWAFNSSVKDYLDNENQAQIFYNKIQNIDQLKDNPIVLTCTSSLKGVGEKVVEAWNKAGIKAVLRVESGIPQNFQALLIAHNIPEDPDQYSLWHSTQSQTNLSKFSSPRIDKDLEDGRKILDLETRKARYADFQKVLLDHSPATFLYFPRINVIYMKKIKPQIEKVVDLQIP